MNLTALVGTVLALRRCTRYVDVPWIRSFAPPLLAAAVAAALRFTADSFIDSLPSLAALVLGIAIFVFAYAAALLALERRILLDELRTLREAFRNDGDRNE